MLNTADHVEAWEGMPLLRGGLYWSKKGKLEVKRSKRLVFILGGCDSVLFVIKFSFV